MDAYYLGSPAASPRGKIRLFGRCQFCNMTNLHLEFWSQLLLPSKLLGPHMHSLPPVPLFQWSILVKNQTCLLNKFSFLHLKICKIIFKRWKMRKASSILSGVAGVGLATSWTSLPIQTHLPFRLLTCYK